LPPIYAINELLGGNPVRQVLVPKRAIEASKKEFVIGGVRGRAITLFDGDDGSIIVVDKGTLPPSNDARIFKVPNFGEMPSHGRTV